MQHQDFQSAPTTSNMFQIAERGWWMDAITIFPEAWHMLCRCLRVVRAAKASRPEVGSSRNRTEGAASSPTATARRFRSPPDNPPR